MTATWRFFRTSSLICRSNHLALSVTYWQVLMERVDNRRVRERVSSLPEDVVPKEHRVLKMNNIRSIGVEKVMEKSGVHLLVAQCPIQPINFKAFGVEEVLVAIPIDPAEQRALVRAA